MSTVEELVRNVSDWIDLPSGAVVVMAGIFLALVIGTILRLTHLPKLPEDKAHSLLLRLRTWWIIALVLGLVVVIGKPATVGLMAVISMLALREYFRLTPERERFRSVTWWAYAAAVLQYLWIYLGWFELFMIFIPVVMFLLLTLRIVLMRQPEGFMHMVGEFQWGVMMLVFCLSHVAFLLTLSADQNPAGGAIGWFLYLVLLTEFNDIAQALWGRPFGKHKIIKEVSPGKSWEGLIGAVICTTILAVLLAPVLTPLADVPARFAEHVDPLPFYLSPWAALAGLLIGVAGFFGDITISSVKRDADVKDSGNFLPGQGGVLDRVDSLTFTAPLFFHYVYFLYYA